MKRNLTMYVILGLLLPIAVGRIAAASEPTAYEAILKHYEEVRQALLHDGMDGVREAAHGIGERVGELQGSFEPREANVTEERAAECRENLPTILEAAEGLEQSATLPEAREAFQALSQALIRHRQLIAQPENVVVYCSMKEKIWMQPRGEIGNPYGGQRMPRCGQVVSE
jgi:hypothetical protein